MELYTPTELLDNYPHLKNVWDRQAIGWLYKLGLVRGRRLKKQHTCEVNPADVLQLYEQRKNAA